MKTMLLTSSISLLLCACSQQAPQGPSQEYSAPDAASSTAQAIETDAAASPLEAPPPMAATAEKTATAEAADGDQAVNDAIDSKLGDHVRYQSVIRDVQAAVEAGDAARLASLVRYPIGVDIGGKKVVLKNEEAFVDRYAEFMTPNIRTAIVETKYADLFVNYKGVMLGRGQAWINGICKDDQCKAVDVKLITLQPGPE